MSELPTTPSAVVNNLTEISLEYVDDIGLEEHFGIGISGNFDDINVLGSIVIENGEPVTDNSSFYAYPDGMTNEATELLSGDEAIEACVILYDMYCTDEKPFNKNENEVDLFADLT